MFQSLVWEDSIALGQLSFCAKLLSPCSRVSCQTLALQVPKPAGSAHLKLVSTTREATPVRSLTPQLVSSPHSPQLPMHSNKDTVQPEINEDEKKRKETYSSIAVSSISLKFATGHSGPASITAHKHPGDPHLVSKVPSSWWHWLPRQNQASQRRDPAVVCQGNWPVRMWMVLETPIYSVEASSPAPKPKTWSHVVNHTSKVYPSKHSNIYIINFLDTEDKQASMSLIPQIPKCLSLTAL